MKNLFISVIAVVLLMLPLFYSGCSDNANTVIPPPPPPGSGIVMDIDSNVYQVVQIGDQYWMAENLETTRYNDGTIIPNVTGNNEWSHLITGAWAYYDNQDYYHDPYGKLYNWYAVATGKLCPAGWRIPSDADWTVLTNYLGGETVAGGKMKSTGTEYWNSPNTAATNSSGFSGLPGGNRYGDVGTFHDVGTHGVWWSSTEHDTYEAWVQGLGYFYGYSNRYYSYKKYGLSCRCIRD